MAEMDFTIERLGEARIASPVVLSRQEGDLLADYVPDDAAILGRQLFHCLQYG